MIIFGALVLFKIWLPHRMSKILLPVFLPYAMAVHAEAPVDIDEINPELLFLQVGCSVGLWENSPEKTRSGISRFRLVTVLT